MRDRYFTDEVSSVLLRSRTSGLTDSPIIFYGASNISRWRTLRGDMMPLPCLNHGFGGATDIELLHWADRLVGAFSPRAVVVNCSQNDLTAYGDEDILSNKTRLADKLKNMTDDLLFLSVIKAPCVESQSERIKRLDEAVGRICRRAGTRFIDISGLFAADCFEDDAHLNAEGYRRLAAVLRGELRQYIRE